MKLNRRALMKALVMSLRASEPVRASGGGATRSRCGMTRICASPTRRGWMARTWWCASKIEPGWHTFSMDNKQRAQEKLAGKKSLGIDHPTEIALTGGLGGSGPWFQSPPKDFSKPDLRWFSWGFEQQAMFVTKVRRGDAAPARIGFRGQACTDTTCKNIDVAISLPATSAKADSASEIKLDGLSQVLP